MTLQPVKVHLNIAYLHLLNSYWTYLHIIFPVLKYYHKLLVIHPIVLFYYHDGVGDILNYDFAISQGALEYCLPPPIKFLLDILTYNISSTQILFTKFRFLIRLSKFILINYNLLKYQYIYTTTASTYCSTPSSPTLPYPKFCICSVTTTNYLGTMTTSI